MSCVRTPALLVLGCVIVVCAATRVGAESEEVARTLGHMLVVTRSLEMFSRDSGRFPSTEEGLAVLLTPPQDSVSLHDFYLAGEWLFVDAWGEPLVYRYPAQVSPGAFDLYSKGADGRDDRGGNDDITDWSSIPAAYDSPLSSLRRSPLALALVAFLVAVVLAAIYAAVRARSGASA